MDNTDRDFLALQEALAGRYSLQRELGRGGMGVVYLAREVRLDRPIALKLLPAEFAARPELRERFLREARTAAGLSHPHIVPIHAVDDVHDFVFMVMAYVEGQTVEQRVRERGPLPVTEGARILREVAWALSYAHVQGVVHRDIKPANILLEAGSGRALVTDFGIAQINAQGGAVPALTGATMILGTAEYMSPEQASGAPLDGRSDIYALGVVGYFMMSGRLPFEGDTVAATLAKQITQAAAPLGSVAPEVPMHMTQAIDRCLAKDPGARFADAKQFADVLAHELERRTQVPLALRRFTEQLGETVPTMLVLAAVSAAMLAMSVFINDAPVAGFQITAAIFGLVFALAPPAMLLYITRRLLRSGYGHDELVRLLRLEAEERREAFAAERSSQPSRLERLAARVGVTGLIVSASNSVYMMFGPYFPAWETVVNPLMVVIATGSFAAGTYAAMQHTLRTGQTANRWLTLWDNRMGRALFKLAGVKLERPLNAGASYRPTELAIGMAADRLFEDLPKELRKSFGDLPSVLRTLEQHAEKMRARIAELDTVLSDIDHDTTRDRLRTHALTDKRGSLAEDVRATRAAAEQRLVEVVAALESIRLQLLRMHAGIGSVESMTADLSSARDLSHDLEHVVEGAREIDELLGIAREIPGDTPVPA